MNEGIPMVWEYKDGDPTCPVYREMTEEETKDRELVQAGLETPGTHPLVATIKDMSDEDKQALHEVLS